LLIRSAQNRDGGPEGTELRVAGPAQHQGARDDGERPERDAAIEVFLEGEPGQQRREDTLRIEQQ